MDTTKITERGADLVRHQLQLAKQSTAQLESEIIGDVESKIQAATKVKASASTSFNSKEIVRQLNKMNKMNEIKIDVEDSAESGFVVIVREAATDNVIRRMTPEEAYSLASQQEWLCGLLVNNKS